MWEDKWKNSSLLKHRTATTKILVINTWQKNAECHGLPGNKRNPVAEKAPLSSNFPQEEKNRKMRVYRELLAANAGNWVHPGQFQTCWANFCEKSEIAWWLSPMVVAYKIWMLLICPWSLYLLSPGFTNDLWLFKPLFNYIIPCSYHIGH